MSNVGFVADSIALYTLFRTASVIADWSFHSVGFCRLVDVDVCVTHYVPIGYDSGQQQCLQIGRFIALVFCRLVDVGVCVTHYVPIGCESFFQVTLLLSYWL